MDCPENILPNGTRIVTSPDESYTELGDRPGGRGTIVGVRGGMGGDVYWVEHDDGGDVMSYCFTEFELVDSLRLDKELG